MSLLNTNGASYGTGGVINFNQLNNDTAFQTSGGGSFNTMGLNGYNNTLGDTYTGGNYLNSSGTGDVVLSQEAFQNLLNQNNTLGNNGTILNNTLGSANGSTVLGGNIQTLNNGSSITLPRKLKPIFDRNPGAQVVGIQKMGNKTSYTIRIPGRSETIVRKVKN